MKNSEISIKINLPNKEPVVYHFDMWFDKEVSSFQVAQIIRRNYGKNVTYGPGLIERDEFQDRVRYVFEVRFNSSDFIVTLDDVQDEIGNVYAALSALPGASNANVV